MPDQNKKLVESAEKYAAYCKAEAVDAKAKADWANAVAVVAEAKVAWVNAKAIWAEASSSSAAGAKAAWSKAQATWVKAEENGKAQVKAFWVEAKKTTTAANKAYAAWVKAKRALKEDRDAKKTAVTKKSDNKRGVVKAKQKPKAGSGKVKSLSTNAEATRGNGLVTVPVKSELIRVKVSEEKPVKHKAVFLEARVENPEISSVNHTLTDNGISKVKTITYPVFRLHGTRPKKTKE
jgi:hypothetical protein